jgi:hypothetical protein
MRITESGLRRLIREEMRRLAEGGELPGSSSGKVRTFFSSGGGPSREFSTPDELLSLLLTSGARHSRVSLLVPDPDSYSEEPDLFEVGGVSFEVLDGAPPGWEGVSWWWPLPAEQSRPDSNSVRARRYRSMLDAAAVSLRERQGESLHVFGFGSGAGMPVVKIRVGEVWEDGAHLRAGGARNWWDGLVSGLRTESDPVEWGGSDTQL